MNALKRFGLDGFLLTLIGAIVVAWLYPPFGAREGVFSVPTLANLAISGVFFFYGLRLDGAKIRAGLSNVKMHVVVTLATFLLFPLSILGLMRVCGTTPTRAEIAALQAKATVDAPAPDSAEIADSVEIQTGNAETDGNRTGKSGESSAVVDRKTVATGLWLGVFFLAALPSTVSSSVVMTSVARGNVVGAVFDASLSSLFGVFLTPLWMRVFIDADLGGRGFFDALLSLFVRILLPIALGVLLNRFWGAFADRNGKTIRKFDQTAIILVVYTSFCRAFADRMFDGFSAPTLIGLGVGTVALFFFAYGIIFVVCKALRFNREDTIATLFCGSKKSLMHGAAMSRVILTAPNMAAILILPAMFYHSLQLAIVGAIAHRYARQADARDAANAAEKKS